MADTQLNEHELAVGRAFAVLLNTNGQSPFLADQFLTLCKAAPNYALRPTSQITPGDN
jgi:hypothetical protein